MPHLTSNPTTFPHQLIFRQFRSWQTSPSTVSFQSLFISSLHSKRPIRIVLGQTLLSQCFKSRHYHLWAILLVCVRFYTLITIRGVVYSHLVTMKTTMTGLTFTFKIRDPNNLISNSKASVTWILKNNLIVIDVWWMAACRCSLYDWPDQCQSLYWSILGLNCLNYISQLSFGCVF